MKIQILLFPLALTLAAAATSLAAPSMGPGSSTREPAAAPAAAPAQAPWTFDNMKKEADLIIIATPIGVRDLGEKTTLPGIQSVGADNIPHPVDAIAMACNLSVDTVLKGDLKEDHVGIYYLRQANPPANAGGPGPMLVSFDVVKNNHYLLFLKKNANGVYEPLSGLTDSAISIQLLSVAP